MEEYRRNGWNGIDKMEGMDGANDQNEMDGWLDGWMVGPRPELR